MFGLQPAMLFAIGLVVLTVVCLGYGIFYSTFENAKKSEARMQKVNSAKQVVTRDGKVVDKKTQRKKREDTLKSVEMQRAAGKKADNPPLNMKLVQAGMDISVQKFYMVSAILGAGVFVLFSVFAAAPLWMSAAAAFVAGFGLPRWFVTFKRKRRFRAFIMIFPNAVDIIVRGIRSGLPLGDCLKIIAKDSDEPVRGEFQKMIEAQQMGITVPQACERLYESVPTAETNFFAIVIAIQSQAGGNLSEALGGLSKVLRERRKMADKIKAVSSEAKTSAIIIGSLPFVVAGLVFVTTPDYLMPLFTTSGGHKTLAGCAISMTAGILIMKKMINFKF